MYIHNSIQYYTFSSIELNYEYRYKCTSIILCIYSFIILYVSLRKNCLLLNKLFIDQFYDLKYHWKMQWNRYFFGKIISHNSASPPGPSPNLQLRGGGPPDELASSRLATFAYYIFGASAATTSACQISSKSSTCLSLNLKVKDWNPVHWEVQSWLFSKQCWIG